MGGPVRVPNRNRGIYFIFPRCVFGLLAFHRLSLVDLKN